MSMDSIRMTERRYLNTKSGTISGRIWQFMRILSFSPDTTALYTAVE